MRRSKFSGSSKDHCRICNRDFGVFLDIFRSLENRKYYKEIEECLSVKVSKQDNDSLKLCHRCVYNLKLCSEFVEQFNTTHRHRKTCPIVGGLCYFCLRNNCVLFDIESHTDEAKCIVCKIEKCFSSKGPPGLNASCKLCLSCAYRLDILYELRETAFKTQKLYVKTLDTISLNAADEKQTGYRNSHHSHVQNYSCANSPSLNITDISKKKRVDKSFKEVKMGLQKNKRSGKRVTEEKMHCSVKLVDVMKGNRNKRKRSRSSGHDKAEKFIKVEDQQMSTSRLSTETKNKSTTPVKREHKSPRRMPVESDRSPRTPVKTDRSPRTPVKSDSRSSRTTAKTVICSPRTISLRSDDRSSRSKLVKTGQTPRKTTVKSGIQKTVKTNVQTPKKTPRKLTIKNASEKLKGRRNNETKKKGKANKTANKVQLEGKITSKIGKKTLQVKLKNSKVNRKTSAKSHSIKTGKPKSKKAISNRNRTKLNCSICNATFSKKVNMRIHELSHKNKVPMLVLEQCCDRVKNEDYVMTEAVVESQINETQNNTFLEKTPEESNSQAAETKEDQEVSLPKVAGEESLDQEVENMDICENYLPDNNLSENPPLLSVRNEKENNSFENETNDNEKENSCFENETVDNNEKTNEGDEQNPQSNQLDDSTLTNVIQESDDPGKSGGDIEKAQNDSGNENDDELKQKKDFVEINKNNNEETTACEEAKPTNVNITITPVTNEQNNFQEEQTKNNTSSVDVQNVKEVDTKNTEEINKSEELNGTDIVKNVENADTIESQDNDGTVATSSNEEQMVTGSDNGEVATNKEDQDKINKDKDQSMDVD